MWSPVSLLLEVTQTQKGGVRDDVCDWQRPAALLHRVARRAISRDSAIRALLEWKTTRMERRELGRGDFHIWGTYIRI